MSSRAWYRQLHWQILVGMVAGVAFGLAAGALPATKRDRVTGQRPSAPEEAP